MEKLTKLTEQQLRELDEYIAKLTEQQQRELDEYIVNVLCLVDDGYKKHDTKVELG
jgi:hypothetical protein